MASRRADELSARMQKRLAELDQERLITASPPVIVGGALVVPRGLLDALLDQSADPSADALARKRIEEIAMRAVMETERELGYLPQDLSAAKVGYDIESWVPPELRGSDGSSLRFLEVKGRAV